MEPSRITSGIRTIVARWTSRESDDKQRALEPQRLPGSRRGRARTVLALGGLGIGILVVACGPPLFEVGAVNGDLLGSCLPGSNFSIYGEPCKYVQVNFSYTNGKNPPGQTLYNGYLKLDVYLGTATGSCDTTNPPNDVQSVTMKDVEISYRTSAGKRVVVFKRDFTSTSCTLKHFVADYYNFAVDNLDVTIHDIQYVTASGGVQPVNNTKPIILQFRPRPTCRVGQPC